MPIWTSLVEAKLAKPQSALAMTFSRPTAHPIAR
jgi:hypothetical protein